MTHFAIRLAVLCLLPSLVLVVCKADENVDYVKEVMPIFRSHCVGCHAVDDAEGGLVMETYSRLLKGGESGAAITPGEANSSRRKCSATSDGF